MEQKTKRNKKEREVKVRDIKPKKDTKGGGGGATHVPSGGCGTHGPSIGT